MTKTYKVEIIHLEQMHTLYVGKSHDRAADTLGVARTALAVGKGTGTITLRENGTADVIWTADGGELQLRVIGGAAAIEPAT